MPELIYLFLGPEHRLVGEALLKFVWLLYFFSKMKRVFEGLAVLCYQMNNWFKEPTPMCSEQLRKQHIVTLNSN